MSTVFVLGLIVGLALSVPMVGLVLAWSQQRINNYHRLITRLARRLDGLESSIPNLPDYKLHKLIDELAISVVNRVNSKLPSFLPTSTRHSVNDYLNTAIKLDATALLNQHVTEIQAALNVRNASCRKAVMDELSDAEARRVLTILYRNKKRSSSSSELGS